MFRRQYGAGPAGPCARPDTGRRYARAMPLYEFRCRTCGDTFEELRPADTADAPAPCPEGHDDTTRLLSLVAAPQRTSSGLPEAGGGCCGGGCCG